MTEEEIKVKIQEMLDAGVDRSEIDRFTHAAIKELKAKTSDSPVQTKIPAVSQNVMGSESENILSASQKSSPMDIITSSKYKDESYGFFV